MVNNRPKSSANDLCGCKVIHLERLNKARQEASSEADLQRLAAAFKVLADRTRLKMVMGLLGGEMCVCDLAALVGTSDSAVSHHLRRLRDLSLVKSRRDGQILYYSLDDDHVAELLKVGMEHVMEK